MSEYAVIGEDHAGKRFTIRRGFVSQDAAEDFPIRLADWKCVWIEDLRPPSRRKHWRSVQRAFAELEQAAIEGRRCPLNRDGNVNTKTLTRLVEQGRIELGRGAGNWRVVTILVGPHAGKKTAPPPLKIKDTPIIAQVREMLGEDYPTA